MSDSRDAIYHDLHGRQMAGQEAENARSARIIFDILLEAIAPKSILDVGCGLGTWLAVARSLNIADVHGIEGPWLDPAQLQIERNRVSILDLEKGFSLGRKFDLAICLEVAEHLAPVAAETLVAALAAHSDIILFSAAIPHQGGHHHVNEQFPDYWTTRFANHGFAVIDLIRPRIWDDAGVLWWLRQNTLLLARGSVIAGHPKLAAEAGVCRPLSIVHPAVYSHRVQHASRAAGELANLMKVLSMGGTFDVTRTPEGNLTIRRVGGSNG